MYLTEWTDRLNREEPTGSKIVETRSFGYVWVVQDKNIPCEDYRGGGEGNMMFLDFDCYSRV